MFIRRKKPGLSSRIKELMWPSMGFKRAANYLALRVLRLSDAGGHDVMAQSIAWGIGMSFFPVFGVHAVLAGLMAALTRNHVVVAVLGTLIIPPVILPLIFSLDFIVGRHILRWFGFGGWGSQNTFETTASTGGLAWLSDHFYELFLPAFIGFLVFLPLAWSAGYLATHKVMDILRIRYNRKHKDAPL